MQQTKLRVGETYDIQNPSNGATVGTIAAMDVTDTNDAVEAAGEALAAWKSRTPFERSEVLQKWDQLLRDNTKDLAVIMATESGKPLVEAAGEVAYAADYLRFFAHECLRYEGFMIPNHVPSRRLMAIRQPVGVCAMITPWNFPIGMLARKVAPALAAGCTAVVKPAGTTPLSALAFATLGHEAGVPDGVLNVVPATHDAAPRIGRALATHPTVRKLSFTGSTSVGKLLAAQCATTMKRVSMELGGNAPFIVFDDANLDEAVAGLIQAKFRNTGQTCVCPNRVFVQQSILEEFTGRLVDRVLDLTLGDAVSSGCNLGPLITPTAVDKVTMDMNIANEEVFGPVVPVLSFDTEADVVEMANATDVGLAAYCYTSDLGRAWRMSEVLETGMVGINAGMISAVQAPFGGIKQSGQGREGSIVGLETFATSPNTGAMLVLISFDLVGAINTLLESTYNVLSVLFADPSFTIANQLGNGVLGAINITLIRLRMGGTAPTPTDVTRISKVRIYIFFSISS
ncbi:hypothetical protein DYB32_003119 [Aphanomyces invadans]|uniref:Succinate-semialdehyde dehydrogenase, mitochondrial n=1 Tax=Aphanomyces invadans TaxID=157072 RepID=A0A3R7ADH7_9STRA|nr:hypothetical protein DYB32_003119 [Aphanomyces invadans]